MIRQVGRYEIVREVGRGGMATVYLARQTDLERDVALKELAGFYSSDPELAQRFLRESRVAGSFNHPNIVVVHDYFEHEGTPYIAMEYLDRGSLRPLIRTLTLAQVLGVLEGLLAGLAHAETLGIVHRDLKPENVMVTREGSVKIADFGIAKAVNQAVTVEHLTRTGMTVGTPTYMAPEQALGRQVAATTDLYSLGIIAYELLAGRPPFDGNDTPMAIALRQVNEPAPPLLSVRSDLDADLSDWIAQLLEKDPLARPQSATVASEALEEISIDLLGPRWRRDARIAPETPQTETEQLDSSEVATIPPTSSAGPATFDWPEGPRSARLKRFRAAWPVALVVVGVAVVVGLAIGFLSGGGQGAQPNRPAPLDPPLAASDRFSLAAGGDGVFLADPDGRILRLGASDLNTEHVLADPSGPRSLVPAGGTIYVADPATLLRLRPSDLSPVAAASIAAPTTLAAGAGSRVAAAMVSDGAGRVCVVTGIELAPCANLEAEPTGLGVVAERILVALGAAGSVLPVLVSKDRLVPQRPVRVGRNPHGTIRSFRGTLFVPVEHGIAVLAAKARAVESTIRLPATPSSLWVVPETGRLFATLPRTGDVAVIDALRPRTKPHLVRVGGRPVAVTGTASPDVLVFNAGAGSITRLDSLTGAPAGSTRIGALAARKTERLVASSASFGKQGDVVTVVLRFESGRLTPNGLAVRDTRIQDGRGLLQIWQSGVGSRVGRKAGSGVTLSISGAPARLNVQLTAKRGAFVKLAARVATGGRAVVIDLRQAPPPPPPPPTTTTEPPPPPPPPPPIKPKIG